VVGRWRGPQAQQAEAGRYRFRYFQAKNGYIRSLGLTLNIPCSMYVPNLCVMTLNLIPISALRGNPLNKPLIGEYKGGETR